MIDIIGAESLPTLNPTRSASPLKPSFSAHSSDSSDILSAAVLHKRRPQKRVRFALKLEPTEEDSLSSSREVSPSLVSKSNKRLIDPYRQDTPIYSAYVEYLEKQDALTNDELQIHRTPPSQSESEDESPTYTHTFVIQSKSPEITIDSITVSTPSLHLPRILHHTKQTSKQQLGPLDSYVKQQLTLSTSRRIIHTKKVSNSSNQTKHYISVNAALKRAELTIPSVNGLNIKNKITRPDNSSGSKFVNDHKQPKKITEIISKPLPGVNNQINHFSERSILPTYSNQPRMHNRTPRSNDELNTNTPYFFQNHDDDHLLQPIIHSPH